MEINRSRISYVIIGLFLLNSNLTSYSWDRMLPKMVEVSEASIGDIEVSYTLYGIVKAAQDTQLTAQFTGEVKEIYYSDSQIVPQNALLLKFANEVEQEQYRIAKNLEDVSNKNYKRILSLVKKGSANQQQLDGAYQEWQKAIAVAIDKRQAVEDTVVDAPFAGQLGLWKVNEGQYVQKGQVLNTLVTTDSLYAEVKIPLSLISSISDFQDVYILGKKAKLTNIDNEAKENKSYILAKVELSKQIKAKVGERISATVKKKQKNIIVVPRSTVFLFNGASNVFLINDENTLQLQPVEVGVTNQHQAEIISGVKEGDNLVLHGQYSLYPNQKVLISK